MRLPNALWYFVVLIAILLLAVIIPVTLKTRSIARRVICGTNFKGLSVARMYYIKDYDDRLPTENWCDVFIEKKVLTPNLLVCPDSDTIEGESSYAMNENIAGMKLSDVPPDVVLFFETDMGIENGPRNSPITIRRHYEFLNEFENVYDEDTLVYKNRFNQYGGPEDLLLRHMDPGSQSGCNVGYADGHTAFIRAEEIPNLQWTVEE